MTTIAERAANDIVELLENPGIEGALIPILESALSEHEKAVRLEYEADETSMAEYNADLEGLRAIAMGLRETARHHQMTQEDWINYSLHTADDINEFLRGLYYIPELTEKLYRALKAMPFPPHMPKAEGLKHDEAISAYERAFPILESEALSPIGGDTK